MICINCGGEYADNLLKCPYCGTQNDIVAEEEKRSTLKSYDAQAKEIEKEEKAYPKKRANELTKKILKVIGILALAAVFATLLFNAFVRRMDAKEYAGVDKDKKILSELMEQRDYDGMNRYLEKNGIKVSEYEIYEQVLDSYKAYTRVLEEREDLEEYAGYMREGDSKQQIKNREIWASGMRLSISQILYNGQDVIHLYNKYGTDAAFMGNEEQLQEIYEETVTIFKEYGYSEEEIQEIELGENSSMWEELIAKLEDYFWREIL